ncbi:MAG: PLP-dependent aminotransferase family protein [Pseudomonadota bacterium]|nr:PLP-dependent aminotransferase family protein [Pseudomonadota bacterium]
MHEIAEPLYQVVADDLAGLIASGQLPPRSRVPSVRRLARQRGISVTTAVASLRVLEQRGLIEARPKSGYFVVPTRAPPAPPTPVNLPRTARLAGAQAMLKRFAEASLDPAMVRLGEAIPDPALFPQAALRASLVRAARRNPMELATYARRMGGSAALRTQIAAHYAHIGMRLEAGELVITNGCMEALTLALRAVARPGDTIAVESPTYFGFLQLAESLGIKVLEVPAHPGEGMSVAALRELLASRAGSGVRACMTIANFSNPTGSCMPETRKRELVRLCREADIALIEDDIYGDLPLEGPRPLPCKAFDTDGRVLLCSSFSKTLAPGARIGFIEPGRHRDTLRAMKNVMSGATAVLSQEMLADYLASGRYERHLKKLRERCGRQVTQLSQCVQDHFPEGTRLTRPQGGFVMWVELPGAIDSMALYENAVRVGVQFVPGAMFSASGRYANCLRLNAGFPVTAATETAIRRLGALLAG